MAICDFLYYESPVNIDNIKIASSEADIFHSSAYSTDINIVNCCCIYTEEAASVQKCIQNIITLYFVKILNI